MNEYAYTISLRIRDPQLRCRDIASEMGLEPLRSWDVGEARKNPKGAVMAGSHTETYCCFKLKDWTLGSAAEGLESHLPDLAKHTELFQKIKEDGGHSELFVGLKLKENAGELFPSSLLESVGKLKIDLAVDFYPRSENEMRTSGRGTSAVAH